MPPSHLSSEPDDRTVCRLFRELALEAGREIMTVFESTMVVETKSDRTPVTDADRKAEAVILAGLRAELPDLPLIAEEEFAAGRADEIPAETFVLVDPLDGTREFVDRRTEFTVNIALVRDGSPVVGVVLAPARGVLYWGHPDGAGACDVTASGASADRAIGVRGLPACPTVLASRSHRSAETDAFVAGLGRVETVAVGSSLKFCLIAEGRADIYPRFGRTMQWDTAAGDAVLRAAGGVTLTVAGAPLRYPTGETERGRFVNPDFIACSAAGKPFLDSLARRRT